MPNPQTEQRQSVAPIYDSRNTGDRYTLEVREQGKRLSRESIPDPFINTTIRVRGWRAALAVLRRRYEVSVHVGADHRDIYEAVAELDDNYKGAPGSTRRAEWDAQFERGLGDFAAVLAEHETPREKA